MTLVAIAREKLGVKSAELVYFYYSERESASREQYTGRRPQKQINDILLFLLVGKVRLCRVLPAS